MKILQINKFCFLRGGAERYFFDVSDLLLQNGHKVIRWGMKDSDKLCDFSKNGNFFKKARNLFWNSKAARELEELIMEITYGTPLRFKTLESGGKYQPIIEGGGIKQNPVWTFKDYVEAFEMMKILDDLKREEKRSYIDIPGDVYVSVAEPSDMDATFYVTYMVYGEEGSNDIDVTDMEYIRLSKLDIEEVEG